MPTKLKYLPLLLAIFLAACSHETAPRMEINRLDRAVAAGRLSAEQDSALAALHQVMPYEASPATNRFLADVDSLLPQLDSVETVLADAAGRMPRFGKVYAIVSLYNQSVITVDTAYVFVGLNHYLGADYAGYRGHFPDYMLCRKTPAQLPLDVVRAIVERDFPAELAEGETLLNRMLRDGAVSYAVGQYLQTDNPLGLTPEQLQWCTDNEARVWRQLMEAQLIYSTDPTVADRLLMPAPASPLINSNAPGETARFTSLQIVRAYMARRPDTPIATLLSPDFYMHNQSLIDSQYSPHGN
jgi:hypothetical protein